VRSWIEHEDCSRSPSSETLASTHLDRCLTSTSGATQLASQVLNFLGRSSILGDGPAGERIQGDLLYPFAVAQRKVTSISIFSSIGSWSIRLVSKDSGSMLSRYALWRARDQNCCCTHHQHARACVHRIRTVSKQTCFQSKQMRYKFKHQ
jgi:hypothetical protein